MTILKNNETIIYQWKCIRKDHKLYTTAVFYETKEEAQENEDANRTYCIVVEPMIATGIIHNKNTLDFAEYKNNVL